ncbi:MAG TPA: glycosyltransferase family A protein [Candidatus Paceibacterota bacterium]|nr:glycosyltransferase family A protein [Candidatus Paceibacterota bacterium]
MNNIEVSVIIPAYNEENYIGKCLESLKKQSYKNFEIIVVDDGSTDKTKEIIKKFKKVRILSGEHKGPGYSRNIGAKNAFGKILVFIDSDMYFDKNYLINLIKPIKENKDIIGTTHDYEVAVNVNNFYSLLWGKLRVTKENAKEVKIFRAIKKEKFFEFGEFDQKYGYADDQTFWFKYKIKPIVAKDTICYHKNPETLKETYKQAKWIGASWKERFIIFKMPVIKFILPLILILFVPLLALIKSLKSKESIPYFVKLKFYLVKFIGYLIGTLKAIYKNNVVR